MKRKLEKHAPPVCLQCRIAPLWDIGWIWECPRCGLRLTSAAIQYDEVRVRLRRD
jgi:ribosomal protein L37AE/L43A